LDDVLYKFIYLLTYLAKSTTKSVMSATSQLGLTSEQQVITALQPVPSHTAYWERRTCKQLAKIVKWSEMATNRSCWSRLISRPLQYYATEWLTITVNKQLSLVHSCAQSVKNMPSLTFSICTETTSKHIHIKTDPCDFRMLLKQFFVKR